MVRDCSTSIGDLVLTRVVAVVRIGVNPIR